jgi:NADH-quinone oxidoreductase subunit D/NADH-quinone oxidoreductase subunit C/D
MVDVQISPAQAAPSDGGSLTIKDSIERLKTRFPGAVHDDTRAGYSGVVVQPGRLVEVAQAIRDDLGFDYLSSATAVDYLGVEDSMEMVYHAYRTTGGSALTFKAQTPRDRAEIPSLIDVWPGVDFQEREAYDLYGIRFPGHPNLKRILLWDGFNGHPMRKDWREPYYEEEHKPFETRYPRGFVRRSEELNIYGKNVAYPADLDLGRLSDTAENAIYTGMGLGVDVSALEDNENIRTDRLVVNLGPHHPSTHGVFRMVVTLNGETIDQLEPVMGYLHRNHEKIGERNAWNHNMPFTDRLDYISSMSNNLGYALAVEQLLAQGARYAPPTYRAEVIRVLMVELTRIVNHFWAIGFLLNDLGAFFTPALYAIAERERILDFFEATAGSRMMCNYMRFQGVAKDVPERIRSTANLVNDRVRDFNTMEYLTELINERIPRAIDELDRFLSDSEIIQSRTIGVGYLPREMAIAYSTGGPLLRASGVAYDVRRADPYSIYPELDFDVAVRYNGDIYDRYLIRLDEMRESVRILKQVLPRLEKTTGESVFSGNKAVYMPRVPLGEAYGRVENPKGELGYYVVSAGDAKGPQNPWRYHVRAPSFINLTPLGLMCQGQKVADVVAILGSIDIVLGETDR